MNISLFSHLIQNFKIQFSEPEFGNPKSFRFVKANIPIYVKSGQAIKRLGRLFPRLPGQGDVSRRATECTPNFSTSKSFTGLFRRLQSESGSIRVRRESCESDRLGAERYGAHY